MGVSTLQQVLRGTGPKAADELRLDDRQLGVEILAAVGRLQRQRRAIVRRPAAEDVHDVNVLAAELHALGDDVGKQLTRPADKRFALPIFVRARGLADKDQLGMRIADAENRLRAIGTSTGQRVQAATCLATSARASSREAGSGERGAGSGSGSREHAGSDAADFPVRLQLRWHRTGFAALLCHVRRRRSPRLALCSLLPAPLLPAPWPWEYARLPRREGFPASASRPG